MLAAEALFDGHPVAHVVAHEDHLRRRRIQRQLRERAALAARRRPMLSEPSVSGDRDFHPPAEGWVHR